MSYTTNCSFCGKHLSETAKLVVGPKVSICRECAFLCADLAELPRLVGSIAGPIMLGACPIGLFMSGDGELCLKTEYRTKNGAVEAYIVASGEMFWGDAPQTVERQLQQRVTPIYITTGEATDAR